MKFISPLKIMKNSVKNFVLNLNQFRNTHFRVLNNCKINYKEYMKEQIEKAKRYDRAIFVYKVYEATRRRYDLGNVCSIHQKFFEDAFVELNKLKDDSSYYIPIVLYLKGRLDKDNPRVEIDVFEFSREGIVKLFEMMNEVYEENS